MDYLWSPWRYQYISSPGGSRECIFCHKLAAGNDRENLIVFRGQHNYVLLNLYPYTSGHLMIAPYEHIGSLAEADDAVLSELMLLSRDSQRHLATVYNAPGFNLGMNIGACAGAGVAGHIHMHLLPRWPGDVNFMTAVAETRVLPEDLAITYEKLSKAFRRET
jgi:ATP adenylyltransferase